MLILNQSSRLGLVTRNHLELPATIQTDNFYLIASEAQAFVWSAKKLLVFRFTGSTLKLLWYPVYLFIRLYSYNDWTSEYTGYHNSIEDIYVKLRSRRFFRQQIFRHRTFRNRFSDTKFSDSNFPTQIFRLEFADKQICRQTNFPMNNFSDTKFLDSNFPTTNFPTPNLPTNKFSGTTFSERHIFKQSKL